MKNKKKNPLKLTRWSHMKLAAKEQAIALGYTEQTWEKNRLETLQNLWVDEEHEISVIGMERPVRSTVKLMVGDAAREPLWEDKSLCISPHSTKSVILPPIKVSLGVLI